MRLFSKKTSFGFSLIELMVVIAIMAIISTVSIFNYSKFNNDTAITNLAYEVALTIREAQVFGGSVKVSSAGGFDNAYGVYFDKTNPDTFVSFIDSDGDGSYDAPTSGCSGECLLVLSLGRKNIVSDICIIPNTLINDCSNKDSGVHITFLRPNLDAKIKFIDTAPPFSGARIVLSAPDGTQRFVNVLRTGHISVELP